MLVVDSRWGGQNGIGRYATEILPRLAVPWVDIEPGGSPSSPTDFLFKRVTVDGARPTAIYSPGYNGFLRSVPQTVTVLDLIHLQSPGSAKYRGYYNLFLRPLIKRNGHVITISETSRRHIQEWLHDPTVEVVNAGIGRSPEFGLTGDAHEAERPYFMYVGNLRSHKNVESIVAALALTTGYDLYVVTSDPAGASELAERHGVTGRVRVFSGIDDEKLATLYRGARATLQPSLLEGFGLPALEGALCGSPVIYFEGCESVAEICAGGGIAVSGATDAREWADAMESVRDGQRFPADRLNPQRYSWDATAATISHVLRDR